MLADVYQGARGVWLARVAEADMTVELNGAGGSIGTYQPLNLIKLQKVQDVAEERAQVRLFRE